MSRAPILYCGDTSLAGAAGYLAGLLTSFRMDFDYVPSEQPLDAATAASRRLYILSDYAAKMAAAAVQKAIVAEVERGAGLIMLGGWETFCGLGGDWAGTPIAEILPVDIQRSDDRVNCDQPALLSLAKNHPIAAGLPWNERPPGVGGFNRCSAKASGTVVLELQRFSVAKSGGAFAFSPSERVPMLVVGAHGQGRTAAFATDLAPHWVGGLVDWGTGRVSAQAKGSWQIEVGDLYARFVKQLVRSTGQF